MFTSENVPAFLKSVNLRLDKEGDRFAFCVFTIEPFMPHLAHELGEEVAEHLFEGAGPKALPRDEVGGIVFNLDFPRQRLAARSHEDLDPVAVLDHVGIGKLKVDRVEDEDGDAPPILKLSFQVEIALNERRAIDFVVQHFGTALLLTFKPMQRDLPLDDAESLARVKESAARLAEAAGPGSSMSFGLVGEEPVTLTPEDAPRLRDEAREIRRRGKGRRQ